MKMAITEKTLTCVLLISMFITLTAGRKHTLKIENDGRRQIDLSTFGFLQRGYLAVNLTSFTYTNSESAKEENTFGFTLMKIDEKVSADQSVSVIFFRIDMKNKRILIERKGDYLQDVNITTISADTFDEWRNRHSRTLRKRDVTEMSQKITSPTTSSAILTLPLITENQSIPMTEVKGRLQVHFLIAINQKKEEGLYNLFFGNSGNYISKNSVEPALVNLTIHLVENNDGNYLSAGHMPLPWLYFALCVLYFGIGWLWHNFLKTSIDNTVFKIHRLILVLVFVKSISLFFHATNFYFIQKEGHHIAAFAVLYYITHLMRGVLLFITFVLIGAGWTVVKHILSDRDKIIFVVVILLQILANVVQIIIEETEESQSQYTTWKNIFKIVDLLCCFAILCPVIWSIRHLHEASKTDGKAAINLSKLKLFRHFYIMIVIYIYFTRILVILLQMTLPFQYEWLDELLRELATLVFFVITGYKFRPAYHWPLDLTVL